MIIRGLAIFLLLIASNIAALAQECQFFGEAAFDGMVKALSEAKSCRAAVAKMHECAWGSSADAQFAPIAIAKCEKTFYLKLPDAAKKHYADEMQLCAYEYSRQKGTMYISAAALCQVDVAARFSANSAEAGKPANRASFDCDKAKAPLEIAICSDVQLGHADIVLSRVYSGALKGSGNDHKPALIEDEKEWLRSLPVKCGLSGGPIAQKSLDCIRNQFELRFTALDSCGCGDEDLISCLREEVEEQEKESADATSSRPRASFDCEKPATAIEIVICADAELGQADIKLSQVYREAKAAMLASDQKALADSERQWLRWVNNTCPLGAVGGIPPALTRGCVRQAFETRIKRLQTCPHKEPKRRVSCLNEFRLRE
jgi:uncharacterized protein